MHADGEEADYALHEFQQFQKEMFNLRKAPNVEETLDHFEILLDMVVESLYAQIYLRDSSGKMHLIRDMTLEGMDPDWVFLQWAIDNQEATVIPDDDSESGAVLLLPLLGNVQVVGIAVLWVDRDSSEFTQGHFVRLNMLANETASRIEAHYFRERIEEGQQRMVDLVESVPHGILSLTADRKIWLINSTMEVMLDIRRDDVIGHTYESVLPALVSRELKKMIEGRGEQEKELNIEVGNEMGCFGLTLNAMQPGADGKPMGYVLVCRDMMLSREVTKLREIDSIKNDFLSLVSHELRTPLTSILAYTEALMMEGMVTEEVERKEYLAIIYKEGERLTRLINDVLDLTKMEAGKMEYIFEENDINEIVSSAIINSTAAAEKKKHKLVTDFGDNIPRVRCDSDRILQVLMNFLSNAIKFTPEGGEIVLITEYRESDDVKEPPSVYVGVKDNGIGIAPQNLDKVFSRFEQIESMDHHSDGTGLGMPICQMIIEEGHAGVIGVESVLDKGATFYFTIPVI